MGDFGKKRIYGHTIEKDIEEILACSLVDADEDAINRIVKDKWLVANKRTSTHFGQPYLNAATLAGVYRMMIKDIAKELSVDFPIKDKNEDKKPVWWSKYFSL